MHWFRYIDDIFVIIKEDCVTENLFNELNSIDDYIKFTHETENNGKLNYLNVNITRTENNVFETTVYRKPGSSKEIINSR